MSDNQYDIRIDDLILFFRRTEKGEKEKIVNRLIPRETYTAEQLKIPKGKVESFWKSTVLADPTVNNHQDQHYYVANLSRLILPDQPDKEREQITVAIPPNAGHADLESGDLVVFPFDNSDSCFRVPREVYENECPELPASDIPDLEFMASEEGVALANVPKVTPQGCSCVLLSLVSLRSGMLGDKKGHKSDHAKHMTEAIKRGNEPPKP